MFSNQGNFLDLINALSLIIGIQNLQENREQSAQNDIHSENDKQAKYLLFEISRQFEEQNKLLYKILNILEKGQYDEDN
jgi:tRNA1(Val) A37 N6-methylase TrmN6